MRIVGGLEAAPGQFPYQAAIRTRNNEHLCGGALLNRHWIVSAAQCTVHWRPADLCIATGTTLLFDGYIHRVALIINHNQYDKVDHRNDIALLRTANRVSFSEHVRPISVATTFTAAAEWAIVSGWGLTRYPGDGMLTDELQYVAVKTVRPRECIRMVGEQQTVSRASLCTLTRYGKGACLGDAGSPLVANNLLIGVVSLVKPCATGHPDVFTRVSEYSDWIQSTIKYFSGKDALKP